MKSLPKPPPQREGSFFSLKFGSIKINGYFRRMERLRNMKHFALGFVLTVVLVCACGTGSTKSEITAEKAYLGVSNYCEYAYDWWSVEEENRSNMYVKMGEETDSTYQVVFHSYTGAFVYFYVDKASGKTRIVEYEPRLDIEKEVGTIELKDHLKSEEERIVIDKD